MARAWAGDVRPAGLLTAGGAALARALLASGLLPVLPARPERYDVGPLRRAEAAVPRPTPSVPEQDAGRSERPRPPGASVRTEALVAALALAIVFGRVRAWGRGVPAHAWQVLGSYRAMLSASIVRWLGAFRTHRRSLAASASSFAAMARTLPRVALVPARTSLASLRTWSARAERIGAQTVAKPPRRDAPPRAEAPAPRIEAPAADRFRPASLRIARRAEIERRALLVGTLGAAAALAAALLLPHLQLLLDPPSPADSARIPEAPGREEAAMSAKSVDPFAPGLRTSLSDTGPTGLREPVPAESYRIAWPFDIADSVTFGPDGATKTRLAGLEGPARDAVCNDREGRPWACGLQARAALNNITRQQKLVCEPIGAPTGTIVPARCRGDVDVAREMVLAGFARPTGREPTLDEALQDARHNERGLWNGNWTVRTVLR